MKLANPRVARLMALGTRVALAALFVYAGAAKLLEPSVFVQDLIHYRLLPEAWSAPLAVLLPVLEVVVGIALLTPAYTAGGAVLSAGMLLAFSLAMAQAKLRGINLDCGCFGAAADVQVSWTKVAINLGLAMLALWVARSVSNSPRQVNGPGAQSSAG